MQDIRQRVPREAFTIQFHRGMGRMAPENTLPTFELAWRLGGVPEADVRLTKDGVLVAFHDANFARLVKGASKELKQKRVEDLTFAELEKLDVGAWMGPEFAGQRVPAMREVFSAMQADPGRRLYLDEKDMPLERLAEMAAQFHLDRRVILASTNYARIRLWKKLLPESNTLHWMGGTEAQLAARLEKLRTAGFEGVTQLQIHVRISDPGAADPFLPSIAFLRWVAAELHPRGILFQALPWDKGDDPEVYVRLMNLGVESFATDYPHAALGAVNAYYKE